jgi:serine/threonine protein kinase/tetratricopeptide (TPR) repeat protein
MKQQPDHPKLREVFAKAVELPVEQRSQFLDEACGAAADLRDQVESLLSALERAGSDFMAYPTVGPDPTLGAAVSGQVCEGPGSQIGRFKLLQQIGEGGFGCVFMAEQASPVRRNVALKIIKPGMDTKQVIARFEAERQALAMMDHPNIAKVFDAGTTDSGRPYFVMELVKGVPTTEYCDVNKLGTRQRLDLFVQICSAVQHAHQKGIIHRDIKPSNVLVTMHDDKAVPKVIDFGIAKATQSRLTERTLFTEFHQMMGTPAYLSPEQAQMSGLDVDTRSDIYSLGVLLYELLTGSTPFDRNELMNAGYAEIQRIIREVEPPRPSTRLSTLAHERLTAVADQRRCDPRRLHQMLRGDLDWIMMKCMEKDRTRRYETASSLAIDIQHYLSNETIIARPPSAAYRFRKLVRRNTLAFVAASLVGASLLMAVLVSTWQALRVARASRRVESALSDSEKARTQAQAVSKYLLQMIQSIDPYGDGPNLKAIDVLDRAAADLDRSFDGMPTTRAALLDALGQAYAGLGSTTKALELLQSAKKIDLATLGADHPDTLGIDLDIVQVYRIDRRLVEEVPLLEEMLKLSEAKFGPDGVITLWTMEDLGDAYHYAGRSEDAVRTLEDALKRCQANLKADDPLTMATTNNLALAYEGSGRIGDAVALLERTLTLMKIKYGPTHRETLNTSTNLATAYRIAGRARDAVPMLEETLALRQAKFGSEHQDTLSTMDALGDSYRAADRPADAVTILGKALELAKGKMGANDPLTLDVMNNLGLAYRVEGRLELAVPMLEETLTRMKLVLGVDHPSALNTANNLCDAYWYASRFKEALLLSDQTLRLSRPKLGLRHVTTIRAADRLGTTTSILLKGDLAMTKDLDPGEIHRALADLVEYYAESGKPDQAAFWLSQSASNQVLSQVLEGATTRPTP